MRKLIEKTAVKQTKFAEKIKEVNVKIKWVFGFRTENTRHPLYFIIKKKGKFIEEKIVYYTAKIAILYFPKLNE